MAADPRCASAYRDVDGHQTLAKRLVEFFRQLNGCAEPAQISIVALQRQGQVEFERSTRCVGAPVEFYRVVGDGHNTTMAGLDVNEALLNFFSDKPAPLPIATVTPASSLRPDDQPKCFSNAVGSPEIEACGRLIASERIKGADLLRAYCSAPSSSRAGAMISTA